MSRSSALAGAMVALLVAPLPLLAQSLPDTQISSTSSVDAIPKGLSSGDWSSIQAAYDANRHAAFAVGDGFKVRNPDQKWAMCFDGRGFTVQPDAGGWGWGLELQSYGFAGEGRTISGRACVTAAGQRVAYDWDDTLQEWYVNDGRGLEHGYTVHQRPPQEQDSPLTFTLAVRGELTSQVQADGRGVHFLNGDGAAILTYTGLAVFDADGEELAARIEPHPEGLLLSVDEHGASYPLTIDPIVQQAYLKASNTGALDWFGGSVSVSGNTVVVGALGEDSNAAGVNGDQSNNTASEAGAAYVFVRNGAIWSQQAYLKRSFTTGIGAKFGCSVSVSGDTVVVGEKAGAVGGFGGDAYVFVRSGTSWSQQALLKAANADVNDNFGVSVSVSGDTVVVGADGEQSNATGVNGDPSNNSLGSAGAAYVFARSGTTWSQQAYLKASNTNAGDSFGESVSVSGDTVVIGARYEASNATGVNGAQNNNSAFGAGAAYVFVRSGSSWNQQAYLKASNTLAANEFGDSVSVSGDTVVVGARAENSLTVGVNGNQIQVPGLACGAAYVFARSGTSWNQQAYLKASNTQPTDLFGTAVSVSGNVAVVAAVQEDSNAIGVNGNQGDNSDVNAGAAYVFVRNGTNWSQLAYLKASNTGFGDNFGGSVSVSGDTVVVGTINEDSDATGVNGVQTSNAATNAGAAYVIDLGLTPWTDMASGLPGVAGIPGLAGTGTLSTGSPGTLTLSNAAPAALSMLFVSFSSTPMPFKCGMLVPLPVAAKFQFFTNGSGVIPLAWAGWPGGLSGASIYFQYAIQDAGAICGVALSNALRADVP